MEEIKDSSGSCTKIVMTVEFKITLPKFVQCTKIRSGSEILFFGYTPLYFYLDTGLLGGGNMEEKAAASGRSSDSFFAGAKTAKRSA